MGNGYKTTIAVEPIVRNIQFVYRPVSQSFNTTLSSGTLSFPQLQTESEKSKETKKDTKQK